MENRDLLLALPERARGIISSYFGLVGSALTNSLPYSHFTLWDVTMFLADVADGDGSTFRSYMEAFHNSVRRVSYENEFMVLTDDKEKQKLSRFGNLVPECEETGCILWASTYSEESTSFRTMLEMSQDDRTRTYFYIRPFKFPQDMLEQKDWREIARNVISEALDSFDIKRFMENVFFRSPGAISKDDYIKYGNIMMYIGGDYRAQYCTHFPGEDNRAKTLKEFKYVRSPALPILREMGIVPTDPEVFELNNTDLLGEERVRRLETDLEYLVYFICIPYSNILDGPLTGELKLHTCDVEPNGCRDSFTMKYVKHHIAAGSIPTEEQRLKIIAVLPFIEEYFNDIVAICMLFDIDLGPHIIKRFLSPKCASCGNTSWNRLWYFHPCEWIEALVKRSEGSSEVRSDRTRISGNATTFISSLLSICSDMKTLRRVKKSGSLSELLSKHTSYIDVHPSLVRKKVKKTLRDHELEDIKDKRICRTKLFVAAHFPTEKFHIMTKDYLRKGESPFQFVVSLDSSKLFNSIYLGSFVRILGDYHIEGDIISLFRRGENKHRNGRKDLGLQTFDSRDDYFEYPRDVILSKDQMCEEEQDKLRARLDKYPTLKKEIGIAWRKERIHDRSPTNSGILLDILCPEEFYQL